MLRVNINSMSDMELTEHITAFLEEREKRRESAREKAWEEVVDAIKNYCNNFGEITVNDFEQSISLNSNMDFSSIGEIEDLRRY